MYIKATNQQRRKGIKTNTVVYQHKYNSASVNVCVCNIINNFDEYWYHYQLQEYLYTKKTVCFTNVHLNTHFARDFFFTEIKYHRTIRLAPTARESSLHSLVRTFLKLGTLQGTGLVAKRNMRHHQQPSG